MSSIPVVWIDGRRGFWDHGQLLNFLRADLYGVPWFFRYNEIFEAEATWKWDQGGVLIVPGPLPGREAEVIAVASRMPWAVIHFMSDEEIRFPYDQVPADARHVHWLQNPWPGRYDRIPRLRRWCTGVHEDTRQQLRALREENRPRDLFWSFTGQATHAHRFACVKALDSLRDLPHELDVTGGFGQGRGYSEYLRLLSRTKVVPCPSGSFLADSFRMAESLEAGCLPIVERRGPSGPLEDYWSALWPLPLPFPEVGDWSEAPELIRDLHADPLYLARRTNASRAWWIKQKRATAYSFTDDIADLSCIAPEPVSAVSDRVTVLMPTSPIQDHPSTQGIEDTIGRIRSYPALAGCEIIILVDGLRQEQSHRADDYEEYKRRLIDLCNMDPRFTGCLPMIFDRHTHQAEMTRRALEHVRTRLVFFVEHDTWPMGPIPFTDIVQVMHDDPDVPVMRFHIFEEVLDVHQPLYHPQVEDLGGVPAIRTMQWSQRPHLARVDWYHRVLREYVDPGDCTMIEDAIHGPIQESPWERWRVRIYAPSGSLLRSGTSDGRKDDPKYPMYYRGAWR